jgi:hypothetical protein
MVEQLRASNAAIILPNLPGGAVIITNQGILPSGFQIEDGNKHKYSMGNHNNSFFNKNAPATMADQSWAERKFRWLPFIPGIITCMLLDGLDIQSGPFSGCWMVIFAFREIHYVGHIGKDSNSEEKTKNAKINWKNAIENRLIQPIKAFKPEFSPINSTNHGCITQGSEMFSINYKKGKNFHGPNPQLNPMTRTPLNDGKIYEEITVIPEIGQLQPEFSV